ncbi:MAG: 16S rRNA (guanine(527)-N(7))-methyltransferase RsmG [Pseudobdellovibrionaceae bacterium]
MNFAKSGSDSITIFWRIDQWFPDLSSDCRALLKKYHDELLKFNKTVNLIGVKTIPMADAIHFADSILATRIMEKEISHDEIYDFGSGNGFPGLIMALMMPKKRFHLVEIDQRKAEFLKHMITLLGLKNADVMVRQIESFPEGSIQCAVSRGFASISKSILMTRKIFPIGGIYYHLKSEEWATEIADIPTQLCSYWQPGLLGEYKLPVGEVRFAVVKTQKINN